MQMRGASSQQADPNTNNTISFKYTVDYPKIELHPFDTKKFSILYNDTSDGSGRVGEGQSCGIDQFSVSMNPKSDGFDQSSHKDSSSGMMSGNNRKSLANDNHQ